MKTEGDRLNYKYEVRNMDESDNYDLVLITGKTAKFSNQLNESISMLCNKFETKSNVIAGIYMRGREN